MPRWFISLSVLAVIAITVSSCASLQHTLSTGGAAAVGGGLCAAAGVEPIITAGCAAAAVVGTEVLVPAESPTIADIETKTQAVTYLLSDVIHWIIGGGVLLTIVAWLIPGQQRFWAMFKKKKETNHEV